MKAQCMQREKAAIHVWLSQAFTGVKDKCIVCHCFSQYYSFKKVSVRFWRGMEHIVGPTARESLFSDRDVHAVP
jgi:hypothetical protein